MHLGQRNVRSAGRSSGSIEITLPVQLHALEGIACRLTLRDGVRPEIVLQPDLGEAQALFRDLWAKLRIGLREADDIGDFPLSRFSVTLLPASYWQERPPLHYADALIVLGGSGDDRSEALTRLLASLGMGAAQVLGLHGALAQSFGAALSYLATGRAAELGAEFERGLAHRLFWDGTTPTYDALDDAFWQSAAPRLPKVLDAFWGWDADPARYESDRDRWYRALTAEYVPASA